jgi:hypothetical protein
MTDTTTADVRPEDDTKPCKYCQSNDHTTNGHFEGSGIDPTKGETDDGGTASPMGHFEGSSIPTGTN